MPAGKQGLAARQRFGAVLQRLDLLGGDREVAVVLEHPLRGIPPFREGSFVARDLGRKELLDLTERGLAAEALENQFYERTWIRRRHFLQSVEIGHLARENMFRRQRREGFRGKRKLHQVTLFRDEINRDLFERRVPHGDLSEAPGLVLNENPGLERGEFFAGVVPQFSGFDKLLDFRMHSHIWPPSP